MNFFSRHLKSFSYFSPKNLVALSIGCCLILYMLTAYLSLFKILDTRLPTWDEAGHGFDGYMLLHLMRVGDMAHFIQELLRMSYWPPGFALLSLPFHLIFDGSFFAPRLVSFIFFLSSVLMSLLLCSRIFGKSWALPGILVSLCLVCSPKVLELSMIAMLESSNVFLILLACFFAESLDTKENIKKFWITITVLFFFKYNYAILVTIAVMLREFYVKVWQHEDAKNLLHRIRTEALEIWYQFSHQTFWKVWFLAVMIVLGISFLGGFEIRIQDQTLRMKSIANPMYALLLVGAIKIFVFSYKTEAKKILEKIRSLPDFWKYFFPIVFLPCAIWCFYPPTFKSFILFLSNQNVSEGMSWWQRLTFYPEAISSVFYGEFFSKYFLLGLFVVSLLQLRNFFKASTPVSFWVLILSFIFCATHKNLSDRYFLPYQALLSVWMLAGLQDFLRSVLSKFGKKIYPRVFRGVLLGILAICVSNDLPRTETMENYILKSTTDSEHKKLISSICEISSKEKSVLLGYWVLVSPSLVHWVCFRDGWIRNIEDLPPSMARGGYKSEDKNIDEFLFRSKFKTFLWIDYTGEEQKQYNFDTWWQRPVFESMELELKKEDSRFAEEKRDFSFGPHVLRVFRRLE